MNNEIKQQQQRQQKRRPKSAITALPVKFILVYLITVDMLNGTIFVAAI